MGERERGGGGVKGKYLKNQYFHESKRVTKGERERERERERGGGGMKK